MLSFKELMNEVAEPKAGDEQRFKAKHIVQVIDDPHMDKETREGTKNSPAKKKRLADLEKGQDEIVYEEKMVTCEDCGEEYDADEDEHECELDEVSDKKLDAYRQKAFADQPAGDDGSDKYRKRKFGRDLAFDKQTGRAKVRATKEEAEEDEHECEMDEEVNQIIDHLIAEGIDVNELTEEQLDEIIGRIVGGAYKLAKKAVVNKHGNFRLGARGQQDALANKLHKQARSRERDKEAADRVTAAKKSLKKAETDANKAKKTALKNSYVPEEKMTDDEMKKREEIVKGMKDKEADLKKRYGDRWKAVMYATATKKAMEEGLAKHIVRGDNYAGVPDRVVAAAKEQVKKMKNISTASDHDKAMQKALSDHGWEMTISGKYVKEEAELDESQRSLDAHKFKQAAKVKAGIPLRRPGEGLAAYVTRKAKAQAKMQKEEVELNEAFKVGSMKLKDGSIVKLTKEDAQALEGLYKNLNSSNRNSMQEKLEADKKSFGEILTFARTVMSSKEAL